MENKSFNFGLIIVSLFIVIMALGTSCKKKDNNTETPKITGCMDANSLTYNPQAQVDDGSCLQPEARKRAIFLDFTALW